MDDNKKQGDVLSKLKIVLDKTLETELYAAQNGVNVRSCDIPLRDGAVLRAFLYLPDDGVPHPVILIRNPYIGQKPNENSFMEIKFAERGYAVINVEVRGTLDSTGEWLPFENEASDGIEVLDYIQAQEWCDGNIGTFGGSYLGHTQWAVAASGHKALKTCYISVYGPYGYDNFYRRGIFKSGIWTPWAASMLEDNRFNPALPPEYQKKALSIVPQSQLGEVLKNKPCEWYNNWIHNTKSTDPYWSEGFWGEFATVPERVKIPLMLHGGWFDIFNRVQIRAWRSLPQSTRDKSRFVIGPWDHNDAFLETLLGKKMYPDGNVLGIMQMKAGLEWFDYIFKGKDYPHKLGTLDAYELMENKWIEYTDDISSNGKLKMYLDGQGGKLVDQAPQNTSMVDYVYDPKDPVSAMAASDAAINLATPGIEGNPIRQRKVGERGDIVSFVSDTFEEDVHIAGAIKAEIYVSSSAPATAFTVTVMCVDPNGESDNIRSDITDVRYVDENVYKEYMPGEIVKLSFTLTDILWKVGKGSRLRVDVSSSNSPEYHTHQNKTECWSDVCVGAPAEQRIYSGGSYPSNIDIPIAKK